MKNVFYTKPNELEPVAEVVRALAHPVRLQIVHQIIVTTQLNQEKRHTKYMFSI